MNIIEKITNKEKIESLEHELELLQRMKKSVIDLWDDEPKYDIERCGDGYFVTATKYTCGGRILYSRLAFVQADSKSEDDMDFARREAEEIVEKLKETQKL